MASDLVEILLVLKNVRQFVSGADQASGAMGKVGKESEEAGKKAGIGWKGVAKWAGAAGVLYGATKFLSGSVRSTEQLVVATTALTTQTGLDAQSASAWIGIAEERHISTTKLQGSFSKLERLMSSATHGSKASEKAFRELGVSQRLVSSGNTEAVLERIADRFRTMRDPAERAALVTTAFGRSGIALLPILAKGRAGIRDAIAEQEKYHHTLTSKTLRSGQNLIAQQRAMNAAWKGLKLQVGTALIPVLSAFAGLLLKIVNKMEPLLSRTGALKPIIAVLIALFAAYKIAVGIATVVQTLFGESVAISVGWIFVIIAAIALIVIGFYYLYTRVGWFRKAVQDVWSWIKSNWPLLLTILLGPIGLAIALIIKHFSTVKAIVMDVFNWVKAHWKPIVAALVGPVAMAIKFIMDHFKGFVSFIKKAINWVLGKWNKIHFHFKGVFGIGAFDIHVPQIPLLAEGGFVNKAGSVLVGERGPELLSLPMGARVTPLPQESQFAAAGAFGTLELTTQLVVDRRVLAQAVTRHTADRLARK